MSKTASGDSTTTDGQDAAPLDASFRDPSGVVFRRGGVLFRQVNQVYQPHYDRLIASGLYDALVGDGLLIAHREVNEAPLVSESAYKVIAPEPLAFVSYPYEWSFSQLKDAALLTLALHRRALDRGMVLKDASAYNVQFRNGTPVFIDTLSFETARERPWVAYRQFTQHFLAPLALMSQVDVGLNRLLVTHLDGVPLGLASALLPRRTYLRPGLLLHVHLHARASARFADTTPGDAVRTRTQGQAMSVAAQKAMVESLESIVRSLGWEPKGTQWADYYQKSGYTPTAFEQKSRFVERFLDERRPADVWDIGANTGEFSRLACARGIPTVAFDHDPACVERNYLDATRRGETRMLPLLLDVLNPSPAVGWMNRERMTLFERGPADACLALATIHHLAVSGNVPLARVAEFFAKVGRSLVIEFVPRTDPQFLRLMGLREDIFDDYSQEVFEASFRRNFTIERAERLPESERTLYEMRRTVEPARN